jgi:hypothetical protein
MDFVVLKMLTGDRAKPLGADLHEHLPFVCPGGRSGESLTEALLAR